LGSQIRFQNRSKISQLYDQKTINKKAFYLADFDTDFYAPEPDSCPVIEGD